MKIIGEHIDNMSLKQMRDELMCAWTRIEGLEREIQDLMEVIKSLKSVGGSEATVDVDIRL